MKTKAVNIIFYIIAACYAVIMLDVFFRINVISSGGETVRSFNLIPFRTIGSYLGDGLSMVTVRNVLGNVAVFIPYGVYLQVMLKKKSFGKNLLTVFLTSVSIELLQFAFGVGAADIDDVLLNVCGGAIGIAGYRLLRRLLHEDGKTKTAITAISVIIGVPVIAVYLAVCIRRFF